MTRLTDEEMPEFLRLCVEMSEREDRPLTFTDMALIKEALASKRLDSGEGGTHAV